MLKRALTALGKSLLIVAGVGYGVIKAMDLLAEESPQDSYDLHPESPVVPSASIPKMNNTFQNTPKPAPRNAAPENRSAVANSENRSAAGSIDNPGAIVPHYIPSDDRSVISPHFTQEATLRRLHGVEERLIRMEKGLEILISPFERPRTNGRSGEDFVTRAEQNAAMEQLASRMEAEIERRFEAQNRSVQSLRTMIARTDELLERVIESIESTNFTT